MEAKDAEKLLRAGVIKEATVYPCEFDGGWLVGFGPGHDLEHAGYTAHLERSPRRGGGIKAYNSLDSAITTCRRMGFARVGVVIEPAAAA